jgi:cytochrome c5
MQKKISFSVAAILAIGVTISLLLTSCSTTPPPAAAPPSPAVQASGPGGAQLWGQNCGHCHNIRSPSSYSDAQWEVVALHMRVRANLTADEHRKILAFLKTAH